MPLLEVCWCELVALSFGGSLDVESGRVWAGVEAGSTEVKAAGATQTTREVAGSGSGLAQYRDACFTPLHDQQLNDGVLLAYLILGVPSSSPSYAVSL